MPPHVPVSLRRGTLCASLAAAALLLSAASLAQVPAYPPENGFRRSRAFEMPFTFPPADGARINSLKLFVRAEPGGDWQLHATATPAQTRYDPRSQAQVGNFEVRLDRDGAFAFALMTVFADGTSAPPAPDQLVAGQTVAVDTRPPAVTLKALPPRALANGDTEVTYEWRVEDENLARSSVRVEARWFGGVTWKTVNTEPDGRQAWTLKRGQRVEVRVSAYDRAGNQGTRTILLGQGGASVTGGSAAGAPDEPPAVSQPNFRLVNNSTIKLQYRVRELPPSGLDKIELYYTRVGTDWTKYDRTFPAPQADAEPAGIDFTAQEDGTYGFTMVATSKAGIASRLPPKGNDPPQLWVEVDTKKPEAKFKSARLANPSDPRTLVLEWEAKDKNLEAVPIIFEYAEVNPSGGVAVKWQELTTPLPNSGKYVCATPQLAPGAYQFRVRMNVFDKAGNVATDEFPNPVNVDVVKPQVEIFDVKAEKPGQSPAPAAPAPGPPPAQTAPTGPVPAPDPVPSGPAAPSAAPTLPPPGAAPPVPKP